MAFDTKNLKEENYLLDEDSVDFAAATTAALGVPTPCLSRSLSLTNPQFSSSANHTVGKGDLEEAEELMRVLNLSKRESLSNTECVASDTNLNGEAANNVPFSVVSEDLTESQLGNFKFL